MRERRNFAQETCLRSSGKVLHRTGALFPGARLGVAGSGGVDSFVLLKCLELRRAILPFPMEILAIHLNPGFAPSSHEPLVRWLEENGVAGHVELTDHGLRGHSEENRRNSPCFRCAWLRRRRLFELCGRYGLSHLALGHTAEDLVTTFFMNLCRNGRVEGMSMNESFFGGNLRVVRPLMLVDKRQVRSAARRWGLPVWSNPCPSAGTSARADMTRTLESLYEVAPNARKCIYNGLTRWQFERETAGEEAQSTETPGPSGSLR